jgi:hypothetical protein
VAGQTYSGDFPILYGIQSSRRGLTDGFVAKLDPNGVVVYSTYLGGSGEDRASGIAVDALGRAYVSGSTLSADFPTANALQPSLGGHPAFRTTDGGHTWAGIGSGLRASWVREFAIDPINTQIVYAGTGSDGVYRSTDGGTTWTATSPDLPPFPTNALVVDATGAVFVANDAGLWRSRDGGASWTMLQLWMPVSSLVIDPASQILSRPAAAVSAMHSSPISIRPANLSIRRIWAAPAPTTAPGWLSIPKERSPSREQPAPLTCGPGARFNRRMPAQKTCSSRVWRQALPQLTR